MISRQDLRIAQRGEICRGFGCPALIPSSSTSICSTGDLHSMTAKAIFSVSAGYTNAIPWVSLDFLKKISLSTPHLRSFEDVSVLFGSFSFGTEWRWTHIGVLVCHESSPKPPYCTWLVYDYPQWGPNGGCVIWFITLLGFGEDGIIFCFLVAGSKTTAFFLQSDISWHIYCSRPQQIQEWSGYNRVPLMYTMNISWVCLGLRILIYPEV